MILKAKIFILNEKIGKEKQKSFSFPLFSYISSAEIITFLFNKNTEKIW